MTHNERVRHHLYETNEGILEHAERIASLEELVLDMWQTMSILNVCCVNEYDEPMSCGTTCDQYGQVGNRIIGCTLQHRMHELGLEVE